MQYRLIKSEPSVYSREQFLSDKKTSRDGVRNFQARNNLHAMKRGDYCFRYHSNEGKEIVGIAEVSKQAYPDPTANEGNRVAIDVKPLKALKNPVTLEYIKNDKRLKDMALLKLQRLSVSPVTKEEYEYIMKLST